LLAVYDLTGRGPLKRSEMPAAEHAAGWIDLLSPTADEDREAESYVGVAIPTREEAQEIETSSRFYIEDEALFLNITVLVGLADGQPQLTPLSFVINDQRIATVRYADSAAFRQFLHHAGRPMSGCASATGVLLHINEAIIDRAADTVEKIGAEMDGINSEIFQRREKGGRMLVARERRLQEAIERIAYQDDLVSKCRESLISMERMLQFLSAREMDWHDIERDRNRLKLMTRDIRSLVDQLSFLSSKTSFLLDATLGLISLDQNDVSRILTIAATIMLPPTLIGTIYGMNFGSMPELEWDLGYPLAIGAMILAGLVPYLILKRRGWF